MRSSAHNEICNNDRTGNGRCTLFALHLRCLLVSTGNRWHPMSIMSQDIKSKCDESDNDALLTVADRALSLSSRDTYCFMFGIMTAR